MPQMMPLLWLLMLIFMMILLLMMNSFIYFFFLNLHISTFKQTKILTTNMFWNWQW